jgi:hypothetical protein
MYEQVLNTIELNPRTLLCFVRRGHLEPPEGHVTGLQSCNWERLLLVLTSNDR